MAYGPKCRGEPRPYEAVAYRDRRVHLTQGGDRFLRVEGGEALDVAVGLGDLLRCAAARADRLVEFAGRRRGGACYRLEEQTSEIPSLMRHSFDRFCFENKQKNIMWKQQ